MVVPGAPGRLLRAVGEPHSELVDTDSGRPLRRLEPLSADGGPVTGSTSYVVKVPDGPEGADKARQGVHSRS
ncbi:hypothetical protein [Streptomyces composti]|uniref:hypothetical protein n=1 Tax=Streptomyces composti TaxID=2720025 RepID=UPI001F0EB09D|nr:hypothetical protein [Streptomyces composti]